MPSLLIWFLIFAHSVNAGIGIDAGGVIMGSIKLNKRDQLRVMELPMNIEARLQAATRELNNNFIVSAYCYSLIKCEPPATKVKISLKGISDEQDGYLLGAPFSSLVSAIINWNNFYIPQI